MQGTSYKHVVILGL